MSIIGAFMVPHPPLIIPEVGCGEEKAIEKTIRAYRTVAERISALHPDTIVVTSPHSVMYQDYFHISPGTQAEGSFARFRAPQVKIHAAYDTSFVRELADTAETESFPAGTMGERNSELDHATMIPLYFVNMYYRDYQLVRTGLSGLSFARHYQFGKLIQDVSARLDRRTVFIASGDLSHRLNDEGPYGYAKEGPEYDAEIMKTMSGGDFASLTAYDEDFCERAGECGHRSFVIMAGALDGMLVAPEKISYEGPFGVGYGVCAYDVREDPYISLARRAVIDYVSQKKRASIPSGLPDEMLNKRAGVFVSIHKNGKLRGCIGTICPTESSVACEIVENAIRASSRDPRFPPVEKEELPALSISVDILGPTEKISSKDELDVKRYGVIVSRGYRRGLLLPNLEGVDSAAAQISIARQKAGIPEDGRAVDLERFEVVRHGNAG